MPLRTISSPITLWNATLPRAKSGYGIIIKIGFVLASLRIFLDFNLEIPTMGIAPRDNSRTSWESSENPYFFGVLVGDSDRKSNVNLIIPEGGDSETVDHFFPTKVDPSKLNLFSPFQVYT